MSNDVLRGILTIHPEEMKVMEREALEQFLKNQHILMHAISELLPVSNIWQGPLATEQSATTRLLSRMRVAKTPA